MAQRYVSVENGSLATDREDVRRAFDVRQALFIFFRRRWLAAFILIATLFGAAFGNFVQYPVYEASAKILVERATGADIPFSREQIAFKKAEIIGTQSQLISSVPVLEEVVRRLQLDQRIRSSGALRDAIHAKARQVVKWVGDLKNGAKRLIITRVFGGSYAPPGPPDPFRSCVESLRKSVRVEPVPSTDIIVLIVKDWEPRAAAAIANAITEVYLENDLEAQRLRARAIYKTLDRQVEAFRPRYAAAKAAVDRFEDEKDARLLDERIRSKIDKISILDIANWELLGTRQSVVLALRLRVARLEDTFEPSHPKVTAAKSELAEAIKAMRAEGPGGAGPQDTASGTEQAGALLARIAEAREELDQLATLETQYARLLRKKQRDEELFGFLEKKREEAQMAEATRAVGTRVIEPAIAPAHPSRPRKLLNLILGLFGGVLLAGAICGLFEFLDTTTRTPADIRRIAEWEVFASIPDLRRRGWH